MNRKTVNNEKAVRTDSPESLDFAHVAQVISDLSAGTNDRTLQAQLSAAAGLIVAAPALLAPVEVTRAVLEKATVDALADGDLELAVNHAAELAASDRARVVKIDWTAASGS